MCKSSRSYKHGVALIDAYNARAHVLDRDDESLLLVLVASTTVVNEADLYSALYEAL